jgi:hypothetical protein
MGKIDSRTFSISHILYFEITNKINVNLTLRIYKILKSTLVILAWKKTVLIMKSRSIQTELFLSNIKQKCPLVLFV